MNKLSLIALTVILLSHSLIAYSQTSIVKVSPQNADGRWGYMNLKGKMLIEPEKRRCFDFSESGIAIVDYGRYRYELINTKGEKIDVDLEKKFFVKSIIGHGVKGFSCGMLPVQYKGKKWGYLNTKGKLVVPMEYDYVSDFTDGFAIVKTRGKYFVMNTEGDKVPVEAERISDAKEFSEGLASFRKGDKMGFFDTNGKVIITPQFKKVGDFCADLAWARTDDGKIGFINKNGEWVIQPQFQYVKNFDSKSGLARVKLDGVWGYTDVSGNIKNFTISEVMNDFSEGLALGKQDGKIGFYNNKGEWVIPPKYDAGRDFKNGYAAVKSGKLWGLIDTKGNWTLKPIYYNIKDVSLVKD